jgi:hypothetical protein
VQQAEANPKAFMSLLSETEARRAIEHDTATDMWSQWH